MDAQNIVFWGGIGILVYCLVWMYHSQHSRKLNIQFISKSPHSEKNILYLFALSNGSEYEVEVHSLKISMGNYPNVTFSDFKQCLVCAGLSFEILNRLKVNRFTPKTMTLSPQSSIPLLSLKKDGPLSKEVADTILNVFCECRLELSYRLCDDFYLRPNRTYVRYPLTQ